MFSLKHKHTLALDSSCKEFIQLRSAEEVKKSKFLSDNTFILGGGSNVGFVEDFEGQVVSFVGNRINIVEQSERWLVEVEAGANWHSLVTYLIDSGIPGLENLALIPGNCGAAPVQNIGAYGSEFSDFCHQVYATDLQTQEQHVFSNVECNFGYRNSMFKAFPNKGLLITKVVLDLSKHWQPKLGYKGLDNLHNTVSSKEIMERVIQIRRSKLPDPSTLPNAGSFFKNPVISKAKSIELHRKHSDMPSFSTPKGDMKLSAGWLIEQAGFKGAKFGDIGTYDKHALVVVNHNRASGADLLNFVRAIRDAVYEKFGLELENEVLLMGKRGLITL